MMTGMLASSHGDCELYGSSITSDTSKCRQNMGLCQQDDILYDDLTILEHLMLVSDLKD
jgi:ABC-type multidrug transport system ATPase subunit